MMDLSNFTDILLVVLALVIVWILLRFILRLTSRIFTCGCGLIALIAIVLLILRVF